MKTKDTRTLKELQVAAREQNVSIGEKHGRYRVTSQHSIKALAIAWREVEAGAGYSLSLEGLREFFSLLKN
jgi:hypothetical protein